MSDINPKKPNIPINPKTKPYPAPMVPPQPIASPTNDPFPQTMPTALPQAPMPSAPPPSARPPVTTPQIPVATTPTKVSLPPRAPAPSASAPPPVPAKPPAPIATTLAPAPAPAPTPQGKTKPPAPAGSPDKDYQKGLKDLHKIRDKGTQTPKLTDKEKKILTKGFSLMDPIAHVLALLKIPYNASGKELKAGWILSDIFGSLPSGFINTVKKSDAAMAAAMAALKKELGDIYTPAAVAAIMQLMQAYMIQFYLGSLGGHYSGQKDMLDMAIKSGKQDDLEWAFNSITSTNGTVFGGGAIDNSLFSNGLILLTGFLSSQKTLAQIQAELAAVNKANAAKEKALQKEKAAFDKSYNKARQMLNALTAPPFEGGDLWGMN